MNDKTMKGLQGVAFHLDGWNAYSVLDHLQPFSVGTILATTDQAVLFDGRFGAYRVILKVPKRPSAQPAIRHEGDWLRACDDIHNVVGLVEYRKDDSLPFLAMEPLGICLDDLIPENGVSLEETLRIVRDISGALARLHARDLVHGDIKEGNILTGPNGWTLIDPFPPGFGKDEYLDSLDSDKSDIVSLARVALCAYQGGGVRSLHCCETSVPRDLPELHQFGEVRQLFDLMLGGLGAERIPTATVAHRNARKILGSLESVIERVEG